MAVDKNAFGEWIWAGRYVAVIALCLILAAALGHMDLFEKTMIDKLSAAHLVQFLGFGGALALFWALGRRATIVVHKAGGKLASLEHLILPVVTIIVVALAYSVLLIVLKPFMGATFASVVNWIFIVFILACAAWLVMAVLNQSAPITELLTGQKGKGR